MDIKYRLNIYIADEYQTDPTHADITLTPELIKRIRQLNKAVNKLKVWQIQEFDCTPVWLVQNNDEEYVEWTEGSIDTATLCVENDSFKWIGYIKHTNIEVSVESISIKELDELEKVTTCSEKDIPLLLSKLEFEKSKEILQKRLKGE